MNALQASIFAEIESPDARNWRQHEKQVVADSETFLKQADVRVLNFQLLGACLAAIDPQACYSVPRQLRLEMGEIGIRENVGGSETMFGFDGRKSFNPESSSVVARFSAAQ